MTELVDQLRRAVDLISQPYLLEVLTAAKSGARPSTAIPADADPTAVDAVVQRLDDMGAVHSTNVGGGRDVPLTLTTRGEELLQLLHEVAPGRSADGES